MTGQKGTFRPEDFIVATTKHVDGHGLAALSMRVLGAGLGVDATVLHRHFPDRDSLVETMVDRTLSEALEARDPADKTPQEKIADVAFAVRKAFRRRPNIGLASIGRTTACSGSPSSTTLHAATPTSNASHTRHSVAV